MLNTFYDTLFKPGETPISPLSSVMIGALALLVLVLNTAGALHTGTFGLLVILLLFIVAGLLGCYWLSTSLHFCAQLLGGQGSSTQTLQATVHGLWPLILSGAAVSMTRLSTVLGSLFTLGIVLGALITLAGSVRQVHQFSLGNAFVSVILTLGFSALALFGLLIWPLMLIAGL